MRVWLACDDTERARRVAARDGGSVEDAVAANRRREASEAARYLAYYGIDLGDLVGLRPGARLDAPAAGRAGRVDRQPRPGLISEPCAAGVRRRRVRARSRTQRRRSRRCRGRCRAAPHRRPRAVRVRTGPGQLAARRTDRCRSWSVVGARVVVVDSGVCPAARTVTVTVPESARPRRVLDGVVEGHRAARVARGGREGAGPVVQSTVPRLGGGVRHHRQDVAVGVGVVPEHADGDRSTGGDGDLVVERRRGRRSSG